MRKGWTVVVFGFALVFGLCAQGSADVFKGPGGAFSIDLEGTWTAQEPEPKCLVIMPQKGTPPGASAILFVPAEIDPTKPVAPQLTAEIKGDPENFPNPRDFMEMELRVLDQDCQGLAVTFDDPDGEAVLGIATVFPAGNAWHLGAVIGPVSPETMGFARNAFLSIGPPRGATKALSCSAPPNQAAGVRGDLPEGWLMRSTDDGRAVQVFEQQQPGALGELCLLPRENRGSQAVLQQAFYAPLAQSVLPESVEADPQDTMAHMTYRREVEGISLRGEVMVAVAEEDALLAHICAPADQYAAKEGQVKQLLNKLVQSRTAAPATTAPPTTTTTGQPVTTGTTTGQPAPARLDPARFHLTPKTNQDGSVVISVPPGWEVSGTDGMIVASGPEGYVACGIPLTVVDPTTAMLPAGAPLPPQVLASPYLPPEQATPLCLSHMVRISGGSLSDIRVNSVQPLSQGPNWAALDMTWNEVSPVRNWGPMRALVFAGSIPGMGSWLFYASISAAPADKFEQTDALLAAIVQSRQVLRKATVSTRGGSYADTSVSDIIDEVIRNRNEAEDINSRKWSAYMRDESPTIDDATGRARMLGNVSDLNRWMQDDPNLRLDNLRPMDMDDWHRAEFE